MLCSTTWPSRCTVAGSRGGRCVALVRATAWPALTVSGVCAGSAGSSRTPETTRTVWPLGSTRSTPRPPTVSGRRAALRPVASARRRTSASSTARNALARKRDGPRRTITDGEPASLPRRCSSSGERSAVANPNAWAKASARSRSGLLTSSHARSWTLISGLRARPGCSPVSGPASLWRSLWTSCSRVVMWMPSRSWLTDESITYDEFISQEAISLPSVDMSTTASRPPTRFDARRARTRGALIARGPGAPGRGPARGEHPGDHRARERRLRLLLQPLPRQAGAVGGRRGGRAQPPRPARRRSDGRDGGPRRGLLRGAAPHRAPAAPGSRCSRA